MSERFTRLKDGISSDRGKNQRKDSCHPSLGAPIKFRLWSFEAFLRLESDCHMCAKSFKEEWKSISHVRNHVSHFESQRVIVPCRQAVCLNRKNVHFTFSSDKIIFNAITSFFDLHFKVFFNEWWKMSPENWLHLLYCYVNRVFRRLSKSFAF